ncbi:hypothetical protein ACE38W_05810 [Chitinophaga sp. Hz27]|uniref:hypothetical protein n=1 Tax=Chitinophaga sp. Hz27 TaxID=3347169 RepID=UPI0035DEAB6A
MANIRGYTTQEKIAINVSQTGDTLHLIRIEGASNPSDSTYSLNVLRPFADMVCNMLRSKNGFNQPTQFVVNFQVYSPIWKTQGWDFIENNFYYQVWVSYKDYPCTLDMNYAIN